MNTGELDGDVVAAVVLAEGKKCFGLAKLSACDEDADDAAAFSCLLETTTAAGGAAEFATLPLAWKGNSLGDAGPGACSCCCSSRTWL